MSAPGPLTPSADAGQASGGQRPRLVAMCMFGGLDKVPPLLNEGASLAEAGYEVVARGLRYHDAQPPREGVRERFRLERVALWSRRLVGDDDRFELLRYGEMAVRSFLWCLRVNADLYVAHDLIALPFVYPAARLRGRPVVYRAHELWSEQTPDFPRAAFWRALDRWFSPRVDLLVAPEGNRARVYRDEYGAPELPLVVPNCARLVPRQPREALRELLRRRGIEPRLVVYYHGGLSAARRIDAVCEAMTMLPDDVVLVLAGPLEERFRRWYATFTAVHPMERRIVHLGDVPHGAELYALCAGADLAFAFIDGSCRNNAFNATATNKLFEYMMCGVAMLTSAHAGYREFVEGQGIGRCVEPADAGSIARAVAELSADPDALRAMGERARHLAEERWHWESVAPALVAAYGRAIEGRRRPW